MTIKRTTTKKRRDMTPERRNWGTRVAEILAHVEKHGPMTGSQIRRDLGIDEASVRPMLRRLCQEGPRVTKRMFVMRWTWRAAGERRYPRAVYALCVTGNEDDAPMPKLPPVERIIMGQYTHDPRTLPPSSVFALAQAPKARKK